MLTGPASCPILLEEILEKHLRSLICGLLCPVAYVLAKLSRISEYLQGRKVFFQNRELLSRVKRRGRNVYLNGRIHCSGAEHLELGENVHINDNAYLRAEAGLCIGDNAHFSRNLTIYTINHNYTGGALPYDDRMIGTPVRIDKNVWIGMNVCILPGVHVHEGAIIGMGAVVTKDVPKCAIVGGNPAKVLKYRDLEHYDRLERSAGYGGVNGKLITRPRAAVGSRAHE